jgi:hypothetical protein
VRTLLESIIERGLRAAFAAGWKAAEEFYQHDLDPDEGRLSPRNRNVALRADAYIAREQRGE